jgi:Fe-S-cluster-containing hydrogenase component 2
MEKSEEAYHYVCTLEQARNIIAQHRDTWVEDCGCRYERDLKCRQSRTDVCLILDDTSEGSGKHNRKKIDAVEVERILEEAQSKNLVARPYPYSQNHQTKLEGVCFCCNDCCGYFLDPKEKCCKGSLAEETDSESCLDCGECNDVCYFGARTMDSDGLVVDRDRCYGCGLCVSVCPSGSIKMVERS